MNKELSKEIAAAVLDHCYGYGAVNDDMIERTSVVVKRVLDKQAAPVEPAKQEPVAEGYMKCPACKDRGVIRQHFTELERMLIEDAFEKAVKNATLPKPVQQAEQEPVCCVADLDVLQRGLMLDRGHSLHDALYAAPVRTKDLTDDGIAKAMGWGTSGHLVINEGRQLLLDVRAVIAADRELNK